MTTLDHLVVAAATLHEGRDWVEARLGVRLEAGGRHATFATHNALLSLGPSCYLEVIAVDADAPEPTRPRWFGLDSPDVRSRIARSPALLHWVARVDSVDEVEHPLELSRGSYRWVIGVPPDGGLPEGGLAPSRILWRTPPPSTALPDRGVRLRRLELGTSEPDRLRRVVGDVDGPVWVTSAASGLAATIETPHGVVVLR